MAKKSQDKKTKKSTQVRPPIVAVLGHIDHGKTSILDRIREAQVAAAESGGITQHIGAYQIKLKTKDEKLKTITFIDTPGHVAFAEMRSRGAQVADLAVLVVAADEGVKDQTIESLKFIRQAKIDFLVAINKIDLPNIDLEGVEKELNENGIKTEKHGGEVVVVPVSAKTGKGVKDLLEMILLLAEMMTLKASPESKLEAVVIESKLDNRRGPLATLLVRNGSLKIGEAIKVEKAVGKIKALFDANGRPLKTVLPGQPAEILGFKSVPPVGGRAEKTTGVELVTEERPGAKKPLVSEKEEEGAKLKVVLKADTVGTLEAVKSNLPEEVEVIEAGVGAITESEVLLAKDFEAEIFAFRVKVPQSVKKLSQVEEVTINSYQIIYKLLEELEVKALKALTPTIDERTLGRAEILQEFEIDKKKIAGCQVVEGEIKKGDKLHLVRGNKAIGNCRISSMKTGKTKITKAKIGEEFGAILSPSLDFRIGDVLTSFRKVEES